MSPKLRLVIDGLERALFTFLEAFFGLLLVANVFSDTTPGKVVALLSAAQQAAVAAIPAALAVLKATAGSLIGDRDTAAVLPASADK